MHSQAKTSWSLTCLLIKISLVHMSVRRARSGRGLRFSGGIQVAHHSVDGHSADAEGMEENAELHLHPVLVCSSRGRCRGLMLMTAIQRLQRNTKRHISTVSKMETVVCQNRWSQCPVQSLQPGPAYALRPTPHLPWCDAPAGTEGRNALLQAHWGLEWAPKDP